MKILSSLFLTVLVTAFTIPSEVYSETENNPTHYRDARDRDYRDYRSSDRDYRGYGVYRNHSGGCWATFYDKKGFRGKSATFRGAQDFYKIKLKRYVGDDPDSLIVGPRANLWLYDEDGFVDLQYFFRANGRAWDLDDLEDIESLSLRCF